MISKTQLLNLVDLTHYSLFVNFIINNFLASIFLILKLVILFLNHLIIVCIIINLIKLIFMIQFH